MLLQEAQGSEWWSGETVAVVTGGNRGIGLEVCRQLADKGLTVIMTARQPQEHSIPAQQFLQEAAEAERKNVIFHTLDISQQQSVLDFVDWLKLSFGFVDILLSNDLCLKHSAAASPMSPECGVRVPARHISKNLVLILVLQANFGCGGGTRESYESAKECIDTNYYGTVKLSKALLPFLRLSPHKARIVMVSSIAGLLCLSSNTAMLFTIFFHASNIIRLFHQYIRDEGLRKQLSETEGLTEQKIDGVLNLFLEDLKSEKAREKWPLKMPAYSISKASLNAYARLLALQLNGAAYVNSVHPGTVKTNLTDCTGELSPIEGAENVVRVALFPVDGPSGYNFMEREDSEF
ncbi:(+)-neomenthol dehydrogenase [Nymphaea thermarum]|nr:(+)-neomenthol dehydrogenase [Nymphaea thermarum]